MKRRARKSPTCCAPPACCTSKQPDMRVLAAAMLIAASLANAQEFPAKPIRFVVPYAPGGASDVTARLLGQKMTEAWGQTIAVDNRAGANGIVALEFVAKSPADGYTILMANLGPNARSEERRVG